MLDAHTYLLIKEKPCDCTPGGTLAPVDFPTQSPDTGKTASPNWPAVLGVGAVATLLILAGWHLKAMHENSRMRQLQETNQRLERQVSGFLNCVDSLR